MRKLRLVKKSEAVWRVWLVSRVPISTGTEPVRISKLHESGSLEDELFLLGDPRYGPMMLEATDASEDDWLPMAEAARVYSGSLFEFIGGDVRAPGTARLYVP